MSVAYYVCEVQFPVDPTYARPLNDDQLRYLYHYYVQTLIPCLRGEGLDIEEPPSESAFVEQYADNPWSPYTGIPVLADAEWVALQEECPQQPELLFGKRG